MKTLKIVKYPILILIYMTGLLALQSCDTIFPGNRRVYKPNIYIYPTESVKLSVTIDFPQGGELITTIPDYGSGWNISVDTNGLIDNLYSYLFYESDQPDVWQRDEGWIIEQSELEPFFTQNMEDYGFYGQEIQDFIDYWIPRFDQYEYYVIYPQTSDIISDVIELNISQIPDYSLRLFYLIKGINEQGDSELKAPTTSSDFERSDFYICEWGVILDQ